MGTLRHAHRDQGGFAAGAEVLVFGVLVFVVGTLLVVNAWAVLDADFAVNAAAREATRTIVDAGPAPRGIVLEQVHEAVTATLAGHGKDPERAVVAVVDDPWPTMAPTSVARRCARVTVEVRLPVEGIRLPLLGTWTTPITAIGQHTELLDAFRSGLQGEADCG